MDIKILLVVAVALLVLFREELFGASSPAASTYRPPADPFGQPVPAPNYAIAPPAPPRPPNAADVIISAINTGGAVGIAAINRR